MNDNTNQSALWTGNKTKLIVIKGKQNSGKSTTCRMVFLELQNRGAKVIGFGSTYGEWETDKNAFKEYGDFVAELEYNGKRVVIVSFGDVASWVQKEMNKILPTDPDYVVCASRSQKRDGSVWDLFETEYTNIKYRRVCFWSERTETPSYELKVKESTVEAIVDILK